MIFSVLLFSLLLSSSPFAPVVAVADLSHGILSGHVSDVTGSVIANAEVRLTNSLTGETLVTRTDATGAYRFVSADPAADYTILVRHIGFAPVTQDAIHATDEGTSDMSFALTPVNVPLSDMDASSAAK